MLVERNPTSAFRCCRTAFVLLSQCPINPSISVSFVQKNINMRKRSYIVFV
jgi:hypothetical protein